MNAVTTRAGVVLLLAACAAGAWLCQRVPAGAGAAGAGASARPTVSVAGSPSPAAEMIVAGLGGFRSLAAEVVWFRADRLQDEGRFAEIAQLSTWLTYLEPHTPEVWAYAAWNLAYNVSVMMPTAEDRWRWVEAGMRLLRDDGLRLNPAHPVLCKELAWLFLIKLGGHLDQASETYCARWRAEVEAARARGALASLGFVRARMDAIDREYGRQTWTTPYAAALYWGVVGLEAAKKPEHRAELRQIIYQTLMVESNHDPEFAPRALREMRAAYTERPTPFLKQIIGRFRERHGLE